MRTIYKIARIIFLFGFLLSSGMVWGQSDTEGGSASINYNTATEINTRLKFPKSPEADAFEKYGNTPVNLYTGTPDITIPLHTLKGREIDIPMALNYDASGVKVTQIATDVGLGWNLNVGGRISRITNGIPDDFGSSPYLEGHREAILNYLDSGISEFSSESEFISYINDFMTPVVNGALDTQLDFYSLNVIGINDYIVIGLDPYTPHTLLNPRIQVEYSENNGWKVIGEDGTEYYFNTAKERTHLTVGSDAEGAGNMYIGESVTSWLLSKIISKNKLDVYKFDYKLYTWANNRNVSYTTFSIQESLMCPVHLTGGATWDIGSDFNTYQQMPFTITRNDETLVKFNYKSRDDLALASGSYQGGNALDEILFYDYKTPENNPTFFKKIKFNHSYFGNISVQPTFINKRLKLDSLTFYQSDMTEGKTYGFEYDRPEQVPPVTSFSQDLLGLFNNQGNTNLIPHFIWEPYSEIGGHRDFSMEYATIGILNKIIYPTKGYSTFEYEQNEVHDTATFNPGHYETVDVDYFNFNQVGTCPVTDPQYYQYNNNMIAVSPHHFNANYSFSTFNYLSTRTTLMKINQEGDYQIDFNQNGYEYPIFLIQKVSGCENPTIINYEGCYDNDGNQTNYYPCLHPTNTLYMKSSTNYSFSNEYVLGGVIDSNNNSTQHLQAGNYQVTIWTHSQNDFDIIPPSIRVHRIEQTTNYIPEYYTYTSKLADGFRIKSIKDYAQEGQLATEKEYKYVENLATNQYSGEQIVDKPQPKIYSQVNLACISNINGHVHGCKTMETVVLSSSGYANSPVIAYSSVFEIQKNGTQTNGYTQSKFNVGLTGVIHDDNGLTSFIPTFANGKLSEKNVFDGNNNLKSKEKITYDEQQFSYDRSFSYLRNTHVTYAWAQDPYWGFNFVDGDCSNPNLENSPGPAPTPIFFGSNGNNWYSNELGKYSFFPVTQDVYGKYGYISQKVSSTFTSTGAEIKQTESYLYDGGFPYRLINKETSTSDGVTSEAYSYNTAYPNNPEKITEVNYSTNGTLVYTKHNDYTDYGTANMVSQISTAKGTDALEPRLIFDYDTTTKNIITTVSPATGNPNNDTYDSYIFGYNERFPVAKLSGIAYSQIPVNDMMAIKNATNTIITPASQTALLNAFTNLRNHLPNVLITTYTYNPVIGVTSETDPKGDTKYYEYDELGRLKYVKDKDHNILSENNYHFRPSN